MLKTSLFIASIAVGTCFLVPVSSRAAVADVSVSWERITIGGGSGYGYSPTYDKVTSSFSAEAMNSYDFHEGTGWHDDPSSLSIFSNTGSLIMYTVNFPAPQNDPYLWFTSDGKTNSSSVHYSGAYTASIELYSGDIVIIQRTAQALCSR